MAPSGAPSGASSGAGLPDAKGLRTAEAEEFQVAETMFSGSIPALVTPFEGDRPAERTLRNLVDWHVAEKSSALVVCGTTGESPTLGHEEHGEILAIAVEQAAGRIPIIAGAGSNSTREAIALTEIAERAGAAATLHATGYYNKPNAAQVIGHFRALSEATGLPIIVYNIPSRTGITIEVATLAALAELPRIVGVKDSTGDVSRLTEERLHIAKPFTFLSGDDGTGLGYMAHGGHGCISVTANVAPRPCADLYAAAASGDFATARAIQDRLMPLHKALFLEPSPGGIKYAMSRFGLCGEEIRAPLTPISDTARAVIDRALDHAGLIPG